MKNKLISAILSIVLICSAASILSFAGNYQLGDVDNSGKVNASDARIALRVSAKLETIDEDAMIAADVNFDGKVNAIDARLILRVSAKLDSFPEEPTSEPDSEPDTTPDEPDTGVIVGTYPSVINTFISGKYYIDGAFVDGDEVTPIKMATDGTTVEIEADIDGVAISVMSDNKNIYLKFTGADGKKYYLDEDAVKALQIDPADLGFSASKVFGGFIFGPINRLVAPILTTEVIDGEKCSVYSFMKSSGGSILFYFDSDENLIMINGMDTDGNLQQGLLINSLSAEIPEDALTIDGFTKTSVLTLLPLIPE